MKTNKKHKKKQQIENNDNYKLLRSRTETPCKTLNICQEE